MSRRLYIVGNGFDLHHGIPSRYSQFGAWLERHDPETFELLQQCFVVNDDFWFEFERSLASFDPADPVQDHEQLIVPYGADDWSDHDHHAFPAAVQEVVDRMSVGLRERFSAWIRSLPIPDAAHVRGRLIDIDKDGLFLTFNYTATLEHTYGVAAERVRHIHGVAGDPADELVLGHARPPIVRDLEREREAYERLDPRVTQGNEIIASYFPATFKRTPDIIARNADFFAHLADVDEVLVMGHSLSEIDRPYIQAVMDSIDVAKSRWTVSAFGDANERRALALALGIPVRNLEVRELANF